MRNQPQATVEAPRAGASADKTPSVARRLSDTASDGGYKRFPKAGGRGFRAVPPTVMIAVENPVIAKVIADSLSHAGFTTLTALNDSEVAKLLVEVVPDVLVLDARLGDTADWLVGKREFEGCKPNAALLLVDRGFDMSNAALTDDALALLTKPVSPEVLVDTVARLVRQEREAGSPIAPEQLGPLTIDVARQTVLLQHGDSAAKIIDMSPSEFKLLHFFSSNADRVLTRAEILRGVWGPAAVLEERTVDVHVVRLRSALESHGLASLIRTVRGVGYAVAGLPPDTSRC